MLTECIQTIITSLTNLTSYIVTNVGTIVSTPVIGVYSPVDQAAIFTALAQVCFFSSFKVKKEVLAASNSPITAHRCQHCVHQRFRWSQRPR